MPVVARLSAPLAFAEPVRHVPPYLALSEFIPPGKDDFPGEKKAMEIVESLQRAFVTSDLPVVSSLAASSPLAVSFRTAASDLQEAVFAEQSSDLRAGWKAWIQSLGKVRRVAFYPLTDDVVRYEVASERDGKLLYRVGQWKQTWADGKLTAFQPMEEQVATAGEPFFRDVTATCAKENASFHEQLARGVPYWRAALDPASGIDIYGSNGIAVGDIDNDGMDEVYVCQPGGLPNRLYKVGDDGAFRDITAQWKVGILDDTSSALFLDLRNTGRQDLVVLRGSGPVLFLNEGNRFSLRTDAFRFASTPSGGFTGMAAADFDRDGKVDLYLCCYVYFQSEAQYTYPSPYHDAQNGPPNFLFRNNLKADGSGSFDDCTAETGMNENNNRFSFAPAWCDYNDDGWPDLYVANDFGRKNLYRNQNGHFNDVAASAGVEDMGPGMSASWFDYDHDGRPDLYVANMWTAAGQRVTRDPAFAPTRNPAGKDAYLRHTSGNSLYKNRGDGSFENTTTAQHASFGRWAWASGGHDFDNDGESEILVTCGMLTNTSRADLMGFFWRDVVAYSPTTAKPSAKYEAGWNALNEFIREDYSWSGREPNVYHARRGGRYFDFSGVSGVDFAADSRAFAVTDFDGDGRPDILLKSRLGPQLRVLQNNCAGDHQSIGIVLRGTKSNRDAIGARIQVDGQTKWVEAGSGFLSQHSKRVIFGLGDATHAVSVQVRWPLGEVQEFSQLAAGSTHEITEGSTVVKSAPFRPQRRWESTAVESNNDVRLHDTWFLNPIPLPEKQSGPGLLLLTGEEGRRQAYTSAITEIDLRKVSADRRAHYEIFRKYLFDWRTTLVTPLALLLNKDGEVVKIYAEQPSEQRYQADLRQLASSAPLPELPFEGFYIKPPRRDYFKLGAAFLWSSYPEQALPYLEKELQRNAANPRVLVLIGQIYLNTGKLDESEKYLRSALKLDNNDAEAWSQLGGVYEERSNATQAMDCYKKALSLKPDLLYTLLNAGQLADKSNNSPQAEEFYRRAAQLDPQSPEAANGLGLALAKQGHLDQAREYFQKAIAARRDYADAINNLGVLYLQENKIDDAIGAFQYGVRVAPDEDILYLNLGRIYVRQGRLDEAREVMKQLLERKPQSMTARHALDELNKR